MFNIHPVGSSFGKTPFKHDYLNCTKVIEIPNYELCSQKLKHNVEFPCTTRGVKYAKREICIYAGICIETKCKLCLPEKCKREREFETDLTPPDAE